MAALFTLAGVGQKIIEPDILEGAKQAVVSVWAGESCKGSGFIITPDGYILTAAHVIEEVRRAGGILQVRLTEGAMKTAGIVKEVLELGTTGVGGKDIAVLKIEGENLPKIPIGDSSQVELREPVAALGFPKAELKGSCEADPTVICGTVNSLNAARECQIRLNKDTAERLGIEGESAMLYYKAQLQFELDHTQPGVSGGPVINGEGEAIGLFVVGSTDPFTPYYYATPITSVIEGIKWDGDRLESFTLSIESIKWQEQEVEFPAEIAVSVNKEVPKEVPIEIGFWALLGDLQRLRIRFSAGTPSALPGEVRLTFPETGSELVLELPGDTTAEPTREYVDINLGRTLEGQRQNKISLNLSGKAAQEQTVSLEFSLIDFAGEESHSHELSIKLLPSPGRVIVDFEGDECEPFRSGEYLDSYAIYAYNNIARISAWCQPDPIDPDHGSAVKVDYDVDENHYPGVNPYDLYCGFWLKWNAVDFNPAECEKICIFLRGGEGGYTNQVKLELKIPEKDGWNVGYYYLQGITGEWQQFCIPLADFRWKGKVSPETTLDELVITFENRKITKKVGVLWVDEISFVTSKAH
jgi:hypothetical protein